MFKELVVDEAFIAEMNKYSVPKSGQIINECSDNLIVFCDKMLGFPLRAWQKKASLVVMQIVNEKDPVKQRALAKKLVLITSRQIGKSEWVAAVAIWMCVFNKYPGRVESNPSKATLIAMISITDEQARKLLRRTSKMLKRGDRHMSKYKDSEGKLLFPLQQNGTRTLGFFSNLLDETEANNTTTITFKAHNKAIHNDLVLVGSESGSMISCLPPTGKALGETYSVIFVDEAGRGDYMTDDFHNNDLYPVGDALDAIRIYTSTPWQSSGFFYKTVNPDGLYEDDPKCIILCFTLDAIRIEAPEHYATILAEIERRRLNGEHDEVARAYYCRFVKGQSSYFEPQKVHACFDDYDMFTSFPGKCDLGIDFGGQVKSRTVVTISAYNERTKQITRLYHRVYPVGQDLSLLPDIEELMKRFNIQRIIPEDCPAGDHVNRLMVEKGWNIHLMNPRAEKVKKYGAFRASLNRGEIKSYQDNLLKSEMLAMEYSQAAKQSVLQHAPGMTDDAIDSFVMSCYFFVQEEGNRIRFISLGDFDEEDR
jgi:hypothetical protein